MKSRAAAASAAPRPSLEASSRVGSVTSAFTSRNLPETDRLGAKLKLTSMWGGLG